ncbi:unnamed protein product [Dicrocoelium dendriticum]|nr:unnamed protein product [Dicrocoelium dendriticum]
MGLFGTSEEANYDVLQQWKDENVELRLYPRQKWVCVTQVASKMDDIMSSSFFKLFNYIRGANSQDAKIPMTKPVRVESKPNPESSLSRLYTMGFHLPTTHSDSPPDPKEVDLFVQECDEMKVFCRVYSGFSNDTKLHAEARELGRTLDGLNMSYKRDPYYFAGYNPPFHLFNRRNEVWFVAAD